MMKSQSEEIRIGQIGIRFLLEGEASGGSVAVFEFDVPTAARVPAAHSHDGYEETIYGLEGVLTWTLLYRTGGSILTHTAVRGSTPALENASGIKSLPWCGRNVPCS